MRMVLLLVLTKLPISTGECWTTLLLAGNDTTMASVLVTDQDVQTTIPADSNDFKTAVAPGYLAILTWGIDGTSYQVYLNILPTTGQTTQRQITSIADIDASTCIGASNTPTTAISFTLGNIWYHIGANTFFYTYSKKLIITPCVWGTPGTSTTTYTIYLGGHYVNGDAFWTEPGVSLTPTYP